MAGKLTDKQVDWIAALSAIARVALQAVEAPAAGGVAQADKPQPIARSVPSQKALDARPTVSVSPDQVTLGPTGQQDFTATIDDQGNSTRVLDNAVWTTSDPAVVVDAKGHVRVQAGDAAKTMTVTLTATDPASEAFGTASILIEPAQPAPAPAPEPEPPKLTALKVAPAPNQQLGPARQGTGQVQLVAMGIYTSGPPKDLAHSVTWSPRNPAVKVSAQGVATADPAPARTTITAQVPNTSVSGYAEIDIPAADEDRVLVSLSIGPADARLASGGHTTLTATGLFADGGTAYLTGQVDWSSDNAAVKVKAGQVSADTVDLQGGSVTITASEPNAKQSATLELPIDPPSGTPVLVALRLQPAVGSLAPGGSLPFEATGTFDDGSFQDLTASVTWSCDNSAIKLDGNVASVDLPQSATATITALDKLSGVTGTATVSVDAAKAVSIDTPFGALSYWLHAESGIKPMLSAASAGWYAAEPMSAKTEAAYAALQRLLAQVPDSQTVVQEVKTYTDRDTSQDAAAAKGSELLAKSLRQDVTDMQATLEKIDKDIAVDEDELASVKDQQSASAYRAKAQEVENTNALIINLIKDFSSGPTPGAAISACLDLFGKVLTETNPWTKRADELEKAASDLKLKSSAQRVTNAKADFDDLVKRIKARQDLAASAKDHDKGKWEKSEFWYDDVRDKDTKNKTTFRFRNLRPCIPAAKAAAGLLEPARDSAVVARDLLLKVQNHGPSPDYWMADPAEDKKVLAAWADSAQQMVDTLTLRLQAATAAVDDCQNMFKAARTEMDHALGTGAKKADIGHDDVP